MNSRLLVSLLVVSLAGCGRKLAPIPPVEVLPTRLEPLVVTQEESDAVLRFPIPTKTTTGQPLSGLTKITVYRELLPATAGAALPEPPEGEMRAREERVFRQRAEKVRELKPAEIEDSIFRGDLLVRDSLSSLFAGQRLGRVFLRYAVSATRGKRGESALSPLTSLRPLTPAGPPIGLQATAQERGICLEWRLPSENLDGTRPVAVAAHVVYRRSARIADPVYEEPIAVVKNETTYLDTKVEPEEPYFYTVRPSSTAAKPFVLGPPAVEVLVVMIDVFPPPSPEGLQTLVEPSGIRLVWNPVSAPDFDSYRVYKREAGSESFRLIASGLLDSTYFDAGKAVAVAYAVTAVDKKGNESLRAEEAPEPRK